MMYNQYKEVYPDEWRGSTQPHYPASGVYRYEHNRLRQLNEHERVPQRVQL
jgi:hypothetical protein